MIDIVMRAPAETVSLPYDSEGGTRNMIIMDLFPRLHDQPKIGRPDLYAYRPDRLTERLDAGRDVFVLANGNTLAEIDSEGIPAPICSWAFGDRNLAYWGARPEICA